MILSLKTFQISGARTIKTLCKYQQMLYSEFFANRTNKIINTGIGHWVHGQYIITVGYPYLVSKKTQISGYENLSGAHR